MTPVLQRRFVYPVSLSRSLTAVEKLYEGDVEGPVEDFEWEVLDDAESPNRLVRITVRKKPPQGLQVRAVHCVSVRVVMRCLSGW